jgi:YidC/Oxa1 family membrane protein insertase
MDIVAAFYNTLFYQPLFNGLVFLTGVMPFHDVGFAVIALTFLVRVVIFPFTHKSVKTQLKMKQIEPELRAIRDQHKDNKEEQARRTMSLYREHGVSPFSGCLLLLVQLPILIALYRVFFAPIGSEGLYGFVSLPENVRTMFLGLVDMGKRSIVLAALAAVSQYAQVRLALPAGRRTPAPSEEKKGGFQEEFTRMLSVQSAYVFPGLIFFLSLGFPAAVTLYWTSSNIFAIVHESIVRRKAARLNTASHDHNNNGQQQRNQTPYSNPA